MPTCTYDTTFNRFFRTPVRSCFASPADLARDSEGAAQLISFITDPLTFIDSGRSTFARSIVVARGGFPLFASSITAH